MSGTAADKPGDLQAPHPELSKQTPLIFVVYEGELPWPEMPAELMALAEEAALEAGFARFHPNACLVNRYEPKSKLSLHQDKDEKDFTAPIVSVSLGLPARFLFGGMKRSEPVVSIPLHHGDVVVWGGPSRLRYHGIAPVQGGSHPIVGSYRINLTFRRAA